ncbi:nitrogenase component 1 [Dehalobacterium formicoaceticum]|uniref:nitrogenase component 1 n=1 Tax=Dehalobacterium formicoaceticum TaxID=51515 RepID=UPI000B7D4400|nr:nitrogenase component 1 [Dehalobacterium formicoaceticum]
MNIYDRYLPQLVSDYSGLHSLLYHLPTSIILLSPSGCNQPIREVDEYRDFSNTNQYTTKLDDAQVTLGIEGIINEKLLSNMERDVEFIAVMGTAITDIIGTDLGVVSQKIESISGKPVVFFNTNGFKAYPKAIAQAYLQILPFIVEKDPSGDKKKVNLIGFHPLVHGSDKFLVQFLDTFHHDQIEFCLPGFDCFGKAHAKLSKSAYISIILSEEGVKLGEKLKEADGVPYEKLLPISKSGMKDLIRVLEEYTGETYPEMDQEEDYYFKKQGNAKKVLIIGEPFFAAFLRKALQKDFGLDEVQILSLLPKENFSKDKLSEALYEDIFFDTHEDKFLGRIQAADLIIGDPLLRETIPQISEKTFIEIPYFGLSGREYAKIPYDYIGIKGFEYFKRQLIITGR